MPADQASHDVRMRGFLERTDLDQALERLRGLVQPLEDVERVPLGDALERVLAHELVAGWDVPGFAKSAVDGYALRAAESFGATPREPVCVELAGEVLPGRGGPGRLAPGQALRIMTGGPVPEGADAVLMAEYAREQGQQVELLDAVTPGRNVAQAGEDIRRGQRVLARGRRLRPQDLGVLASLGRSEVEVLRRPVVALVTTGDELVEPEQAATAPPGSVVNSNLYVLEALVRQHGGEPRRLGILRDDPAELRRMLQDFPGDLLVTTGATSVGKEDWLPVLLAEVGELLVHGLNIRPAYPAGFGHVGGRPVVLLPGNPVAAMVGFDVLVRVLLQRLLGQPEQRRHCRVRARLKRKLASDLNRIDFVRVRLVDGEVEPLRLGGAGVLTTMTRADGFVIVPRDVEGLEAGELVEVFVW